MNVYFIILLLTLLLQLRKVSTDKQYLIKTITSFIPFFIYACIRVDFGPDYSSYERFFERIHGTTFSQYDRDNEHMEIGFAILNMIVPTWRFFIILDSLLIASAYVMLFYRYIPQKISWLGVLLLFFTGNNSIFFDLVAMRNGMVVAMLVLSLPLIEKRLWKPFVVVTLLALTIHSSAIFFFPLAYFLGRNTILNKREVYIWIVVIPMFALMSSNSLLNRITPVILLIGNTYEGQLNELQQSTGARGVIATLYSIVLLGMFLWSHYKEKEYFSPKENMIIRLSMMFALSYLLGALNTRFSQYFILFFLAASCILFKRFRNKIYSKVLIGLSIAYSIYSFYYVWMLKNPYFVYQTFHSIFD